MRLFQHKFQPYGRVSFAFDHGSPFRPTLIISLTGYARPPAIARQGALQLPASLEGQGIDAGTCRTRETGSRVVRASSANT